MIITNAEIDEDTDARHSSEISSHYSSVPDVYSQSEIIIPPDEPIESSNRIFARISHSSKSSPSTSHNSDELRTVSSQVNLENGGILPTSSLRVSSSLEYNEELPTKDIGSLEHSKKHPQLPNTSQVVKFSTLPTETIVLENFEKWLLSMDGGCQAPGIAYRSKLIVKNAIQSIGLEFMMQPKTVCQYFTDNNNITAATTNVYLRYLSSFLLYMHEEYPKVFTSEDHQLMRNRISR